MLEITSSRKTPVKRLLFNYQNADLKTFSDSANLIYSDAGGVEDGAEAESSFMNNTTKNVIHQKGMLIINQSKKLLPLLLAIIAGHSATITDKKKIMMYQSVVNV